MSKTKFVHELRKSIEHYAKLGVVFPPTLFIECKVRPTPKRKFDLMTGLTVIQKATLRAITTGNAITWKMHGNAIPSGMPYILCASKGHAFLAVRLGKDKALVVNFKKIWELTKSFPVRLFIQPPGELIFHTGLSLLRRKPLGLWENLDEVLNDK